MRGPRGCGGLLLVAITKTLAATWPTNPQTSPKGSPATHLHAPPSPRIIVRMKRTDPRAPTIHMIAPAHTCVSEDFNHCAFTGKVLRFPLVCPDRYPLRIYGNGVRGSDNGVEIYTRKQLAKKLGVDDAGLLAGASVTHGYNEAHRAEFNVRTLAAIKQRAKLGDIIAHPVGAWTETFVKELPGMIHVETGIGYQSGPMGAYRIFETEHWRAWHMGRYVGVCGTWPDYPEFSASFVAPNYYDPEDWPINEPRLSKPYALFVGRMCSSKGIEIVEYLARNSPDLEFRVVSGEPRSDRLSSPNINWCGRVTDRSALAAYYANALCTIVPSRFWEPFGGVAVESLLCGTPVIASDWAAFTETVTHPDDGVRFSTTRESLQALAMVLGDDGAWQTREARTARRARAIDRWGVDTVKQIYTGHFRSIETMHNQGVKPPNHP